MRTENSMPEYGSAGVVVVVMESKTRLALAQHYGEIQAERHGDELFHHPDTWHYILGEEPVHAKKLLPGGVVFLVIDLSELTEAERSQYTQEVIVSHVSDFDRKIPNQRANHLLVISPVMTDITVQFGEQKRQCGHQKDHAAPGPRQGEHLLEKLAVMLNVLHDMHG